MPDTDARRTIDNPSHRLNTTRVLIEPSEAHNDSSTSCETRVQPRDSGLFLIGLFKLSKAIFFLGVSLGALHFVHHDLSGTVGRLIQELHVDPESRMVDLVTDRVAQITHHKLRLISMGTSLYAMLCTTEAYGLLRRKVWAEFVTLWLSISFIPWELFELGRHATLIKLAVLLTNVAVVAYLVWMLRRKKSRAAANPA